MKQKKSKATSEKPTADDVGTAYSLGAQQAAKEPLEQDSNWSTGDGNMEAQRQEAHQEALDSEADHYRNSHPNPEPPAEIFEVPPETEKKHTPYIETKIEMSQNLANRRKAK